MPSFDIVCKVDPQELDNALNQARKEVLHRFDLKNSKSEITFENNEIKLTSNDEYKIRAVFDILQSKLIKRGISPKAFQAGKIEQALQGQVKQSLKLQEGIPTDKAHEIVKSIKHLKLKVQPQIMGDQLRVTGKQIDDLQTVIQMLRENDHGIHMDFVNMK